MRSDSVQKHQCPKSFGGAASFGKQHPFGKCLQGYDNSIGVLAHVQKLPAQWCSLISFGFKSHHRFSMEITSLD